jgi:hypothetical protein
VGRKGALQLPTDLTILTEQQNCHDNNRKKSNAKYATATDQF